MQQREMMRRLVAAHGRNEAKVCAAYASAEKAGLVTRRRNTHNLTAIDYAHALWRDGVRRNWF
jgi:hypothetical protein